MTDIPFVTGAEFVRKVKKVGRRKGVSVELIAERGRGGHGTLYYGARRTVVKHRQAELSPGLLHAMLVQLGLTLEDLQQG
jgi:mRNA interferase HicA